MESSLWCVADALVYEPRLLALSLVPGAVFTSWLLVDGVAGNTQLLLLCEHKAFTSPRCAARGHVFNTTSHQQCTTGPQTRGELFGGNCEIYSESASFLR